MGLHQVPAAPRPPRLVPAPPLTSRYKEEAAQLCSGTHLQGSDAGCHTTHRTCVSLDFFQKLIETTLQEATTRVRMSKGLQSPNH